MSVQVVEAAHRVGLRTTSTIMFGHIDHPAAWAQHLASLRDLQKRSGGITEFVPLPFVHMQAPIYLKGEDSQILLRVNWSQWYESMGMCMW